ncbi:MAG: uroporphyrinogen III synthase [Hyphomicrobium sp.]|nr:MAG: uroporphyrinogen III synthase [Hyphomicrobium sp.]PPD00692.1 MAG: uroporphyrinogen III synthase [Hyphomicrobium sp.]
MHVLITRPKADAQDLKQRIEALGCAVSIAPLIEIAWLPIATDALNNSVGIIATSRNALAALENSEALGCAQKLPLYAVGNATAQVAHRLGFENVITGAGTAADLVPQIVAQNRSKSGALIHLAGDHLAFDLKSALSKENIQLQQITVYRSIAAPSLPSKVIEDLACGAIDAVVLMSPRTAQTWCELMTKLALQVNTAGLTYICLSEAVANALTTALHESGDGTYDIDRIRNSKVKIAQSPDLNSLLAVVQSLAGDTKTG